jgi:hypothetical protein
MKHIRYPYSEDRQVVWALLIHKYGFDRVWSHSNLIIRALDNRFPLIHSN